jgi:AcrR family transcriptional regulator
MRSLRSKISAAAQELYLRDGIGGFSMRRVAEMVGVSAPAIYRHFKNKDELLNEIVIEGLKILEEYLRPALEADTPYDRLVCMTDHYLRFAMERPQYFDFAFLIPNPGLRPVADEIARPDWDTFRLAVEQVAACTEAGIFPGDDPLETAITLWAEVHGLITLFRTGRFGPNPETFREIYRQSVDRTLRGLKALTD